MLPNYLRLPGGQGAQTGQLPGDRRPRQAAAGQVQSFLSGTEARRIKWRLCHCSTTSTASASSRWNMLSRINTGQRDVSGEGTYGRTLANPAVWLGQKRLTETDRRPGQDWRSSLSQGPGSITSPPVVPQECAPMCLPTLPHRSAGACCSTSAVWSQKNGLRSF